jgi:hypothetical protein
MVEMKAQAVKAKDTGDGLYDINDSDDDTDFEKLAASMPK